MDNKKAVIDQLNISELFPQKMSFEKTGVLEISKIAQSFEPETGKIDLHLGKLNPDDRLKRIIFPLDLDPKVAASFLKIIDAAVFVPLKSDEAVMKHFLAKSKAISDFIEKYDSVPNLQNHPTVGPFYKALTTNKNKIDLIPVGDDTSNTFVNYLQPESYEHNAIIFKYSRLILREKINFMYYLCGDDVDSAQLSPEELHSKAIYKEFVLNYVSEIQKSKDEDEQNAVFEKFMRGLVMDARMFMAKVSQFSNNFGQLKFSKPLSMPIILDDGSRTDLFKLDNTKIHKVMCSVFVSKINQITDFSNLIINGDFVCNKTSVPVVLPKQINGNMDLSEYPFISTIIHIPDGTKGIDLSHSIKSFADLNKLKFPKTTTEIRVARSLINNALKKVDELKQIQIFAGKYPDIEIWDTKGEKSLREELEKQQQILEKKKQPVKPVENTAPKKKQEICEKTSDWLTRKEIIDIFSKDERFADVDDLDRLVKRATKSNNIRMENKLVNGQSVLCVHADNINIVIDSGLQIIQEDIARSDNKENVQKKTVVKNKEPEKDKSQKTKNIKTLHIEKYIPRGIWKDICDSCNDSNQILYSILETINRVNTNYAKQQTQQSSIQYVDENGNLQPLSRTKTKGGKAATQALESKDNRRIVWTINPTDKIMVATAFFKQHDKGNSANDYNSIALPNAAKGYLMDGKTIVNKELVQSDEFLKVSDLLEQYKSEKTNIDKEETKPVVEPEPVVKPEPKTATKAKPESKQIIHTESFQVAKQKIDTPKIDLTTIGKTSARKHYTVHNLIDVKAVEAEINALIAGIDREIKQLSIEMGKQKDSPSEQLKTVKLITKLINDKINLMGQNR